jgi:predicted nucleotide-binding protein (sugar kinase/HSP70/actin superfamily)
MKVGIPRALLYYQYYPMWKTFFEELGASVLVSGPTTKATLAAGVERLVAETCLPVKVYCGHVLELTGQVDYVFVPAVRSLEPKVLHCSHFLGLPDLVRAVIPEAPPLLAPDIDLDQESSEDKYWQPPTSDISFKARRVLYQTIYQLGSHFTRNPLRIKAAAERAWQVHQDYLCLMQTGLTPPEAIARWEGNHHPNCSGRIANPAGVNEEHTIALIGHPYNLYDAYTTHNLVAKLRGLGVKVVTSETATPEELRQGILDLTGQPYWTYEDEMVGAAGHYLRDERVDGFTAVSSFGCGPDSTLLDVVQRATREAGRPFMSLILDEHTGEAGLVTRLEAFVDMLARWKRRTLAKV